MKTTRRMLTFALAIIMLVSVMTVTAAAASGNLDSEWRVEFRRFPTMSRNTYNSSYTRALQRFLSVYPGSDDYVDKNGGIDGIYGNDTFNAVKVVQTEAKNEFITNMYIDGVTGGDTWASVAYYLDYDYSGSNNVYGYMQYDGYNVMKYHYTTDKGPVLSYYGNYGAIGSVFHDVVGTLPEY